jgi:hypothetical protein
MFCVTQVCTKYDSIRVATWMHDFSWVLRATVFVSHILNMTSEACVAIILALECSPEKAKQRSFYINDWIPIDTCCATSPLTMQTSCATAVLHKKITEQFWFYATDCANCQSAPFTTVNQLHNTQCCATWLDRLDGLRTRSLLIHITFTTRLAAEKYRCKIGQQ